MFSGLSTLAWQWSALVWQWPLLFILLPIPLLLRLMLPAKNRQFDALRVPFFSELQSLQAQHKSGANLSWIAAIVCALIWILLVTAAARPTWIGDPVPLPQEGRDLMLAVDISRSMEEQDMRVRGGYASRVAAVKHVVGEFIQQRNADRIGLILFGERAYLQTPLTFDRKTVRVQLEEAQLGFAGNATAIGDAIGISIKRLRDRPAESRVLILLTDGASNAGTDPREAAKIAAEANIRIHTIGVGAESRSGLIRLGGASLDEKTLQFVAQTTGGQYFRARDPAELQSIYNYIDKLEPAPEEMTFRPQKSLFHIPLVGALVLSGLLMLVRLVPFLSRRMLA